VAVVSY